jgi:hypothetical protein
MLTEDEARTAYEELLEKLQGIGAHDLASEIARAVGAGRVQVREREHVQERLPAVSALEIALRMLAAWIEPPFLVSEAQALLSDASGTEFDGVNWLHDRLDVVESEAQVVAPTADQSILAIPPLDTASDEVRSYVQRLYAIAKELAGSEGK